MDWDEIFDRYSGPLVLFARQWVSCHSLAEDAVQEGFIRTWRAFTGKRVNEDGVVPYLYRAVKSSALDYLRGSGRRQKREQEHFEDSPKWEPFFLPDSKNDEQKVIEGALRELPEEQREVIVMKIWGDQTFEAIGKAVGISQNTAASRYRYGMETLRKILGGEKKE